MFLMHHDSSSPVPNPALLGDLADLLLAEEAIAHEMKRTGRKPGAVTGFASLDDEIGGYLAIGVHTLLAAPGAGKSALALQIAGSAACPCLYITSEMRRAELLRRIVARVTDTYLGKLRGGELSEVELRARVKKAAEQCPMLSLYDVREHKATSDDIRARAESLRERFDSPQLLLIIDSVTDWAANSVGEEARALVGDFAIAEKAITNVAELASTLSCPIIAIAHRNRTGQSKEADKLHSAKGTGRYEYVSESVWSLERDAKKEADDQGCTPATLEILKNRHGGTGLNLKLKFEGRVQKFTEV